MAKKKICPICGKEYTDSFFGSQERISSVECTYSLSQGVIATTAFDFGEMVLTAA